MFGFFRRKKPTDVFKDMDPLDREMPGEPHFALMGRDILGICLVAVYAAARERKTRAEIHRHLDVALDRWFATPPNAEKEKRHAWSARAKAAEMYEWFIHNRIGDAPRSRVNSPPPVDDLGLRPTLNEIRKAIPPPEPDEAT